MTRTNTEVEKALGAAARRHGFEAAHGGWIKRGQGGALVLKLQRSNLGEYLDLNVKVFLGGKLEVPSRSEKSMIKSDVGDVFRRPPSEYQEFFSLESEIDEATRSEGIEKMFEVFVDPFSAKALTRRGLLDLAAKGDVHLLPAIRQFLEGDS